MKYENNMDESLFAMFLAFFCVFYTLTRTFLINLLRNQLPESISALSIGNNGLEFASTFKVN